jgi:hypothetical protein
MLSIYLTKYRSSSSPVSDCRHAIRVTRLHVLILIHDFLLLLLVVTSKSVEFF